MQLDDDVNTLVAGTYNNLKTGLVDIYGINYYKPDLVETIISKRLRNKTIDYENLIEWLSKAKGYNGFYGLQKNI